MSVPSWWSELSAALSLAGWSSKEKPGTDADQNRSLSPQLSEEMADECEQITQRSLILAEGPALVDRRTRSEYARALLWYDPERPEQPWLDLGAFPAILWLPVAASAEAVGATIREYFRPQHPNALELTSTRRWITGIPSSVLYDVTTGDAYADEKLPAEEAVTALAKQFILNFALEGIWWGSAHDADPFPGAFEPGNTLLELARSMNEAMRQDANRVAACNFRTRWSGSILRGECHFGYFLVLQATYAPARHQSTIRWLNERFETSFPEDLPIDLVAALLGRHLGSADAVEAEAFAPGAHTPSLLHALAAILHDDLRLVDILRRAAASDDRKQRGAVAYIAHHYGYERLLLELSCSERDPELLRRLRAGVLRVGV